MKKMKRAKVRKANLKRCLIMKRRFIGNNRGEGYIDTAVTIFAVAMLLALSVNFFSLFVLKQDVDTIAGELAESASFCGGTGTEFQNRVKELKEGFGITFTVDTTGTEYRQGSSEKVQLGDTIEITVSASMDIKGFGTLKIPVKVSCKQSGVSRVYWK